MKYYNGGNTIFMPEEIYLPVEMDIAYRCEDGFLFQFNFNNRPTVYTTCQPNGIIKLHGKFENWPNCVDRKYAYIYPNAHLL